VRPHTPYKQHDSKYIAPPKRNVRAIQPIKVKIDRRVMCPWDGEKRKRRHRRRRKKNCVCGNGTRLYIQNKAPEGAVYHAAISATRPSPSLRAASPESTCREELKNT
jgi:hypothetical protein